MSQFYLPLLAAFVLGYGLGSIPFGLLLTRAAGLGDIRNVGSGNIGATNVLRTGNKGLAAATLVLDALKGTAAVALTGMALWHFPMTLTDPTAEQFMVAASRQQSLVVAAGLGAFLGHLYPVWLGFKGGKGVATYIGVLIGLAPIAGLAFCATWLVTAVASRYSSLSALVASVVTPIAVWIMGAPRLALLLVPMTVLLIYKHTPNIRRLLAGEEPKIGAKS